MTKRFVIVIASCVLTTFAVAQAPQQNAAVETSRHIEGGPPEKKAATAQQQKYGMQLLEIAEADAGGLEGGMRAWALLQIARGYEQSNKAKAIELLESALTSSRGMDEDKSQTRMRVQEQILKEMVPLAPERVDNLLTLVDAAGRAKALNALLAYYEKNKQLGRAIEVINRIAAEAEVPYDATIRVMQVLKPEQSAEFMQLFNTSLASFRDHADDHGQRFDMGGGFGDMVVRYWQRLPKEVTRQAIDEMLNQADPENQKDKARKSSISLASDKGTVSFSSLYEYRLFQLLPVLREIDESAAEQYLKKYREVSTMLDKYPDGTGSLVPPEQPRGKDNKNNAALGMSFSVSGQPDSMAARMAEMHRAQKLVADAEAGKVADAMANVPTISQPNLRANCYHGIAMITMKKQPSTARSALDKMLESADKLEASEQLPFYRDAVEVYLRMDDTDSAKKIIEKGLAIADKVYQSDSNADDPNKALKAFWPATNAYRALLAQAGSISPTWALTLLKEISDPEVKVAAESALAGSWLNVPMGETLTMVNKKSGSQMRMQVED